jgi:2'-5' RNA ligase
VSTPSSSVPAGDHAWGARPHWQLGCPHWTPTREDILSAVKAQECPAIRRPRLKIGHTDPRFNTDGDGDGQPALGWFENLRAEDGGNTLLGDQMALPWLSSVQAAAYPDRSIEGNYRHVCSLGHTHPFVITAVALLGVTPPAVSTLKSVQDLPEMLGVAASEDDTAGAEHVQVTIRAAAEVHTGAMIALIPTAEDATRLAVDGGEPAEQLHLTLAYLGEAANLGARGQQDVIDAVSTAANGLPLLEAEIFSVNAFNPGGADDRDPCLVWGLTGDMLDAVHDIIDDTLHLIDAPIPSQHRPWASHITAAYTADMGRIAELASRVGPVKFDRLRLAFGDEFIDIPLMEWPGEEVADPGAIAAANGNADNLHDYWTKGAGLAKWRDKPHPWTALFRHLSKFLSPDRAKRTASEWYRDVFGHMPNQKGVKAGAGNGAPPMTRAEQIRAAWNASGAPLSQWVQEARTDAVVVVDDTDRSYRLVPVSLSGDEVVFGEPQAYDPESDRPLVFASRAESRPEAPVAASDPASTAFTPPAEPPATVLPAAEPEQVINPDPKEDLVSTDLSALRSRLGLSDDTDDAATLAAIDAALTKAEAPVEPTPEMVAASAAAETEKDELRKEVQVLASRMEQVSTELAATKAKEAATVKASVFDAAVKNGQIKPADREQWEKDYDEAPAAVTRVLASIAVGSAVPVMASGVVGEPEPTMGGFSDDDLTDAFFGPGASARFKTQEA